MKLDNENTRFEVYEDETEEPMGHAVTQHPGWSASLEGTALGGSIEVHLTRRGLTPDEAMGALFDAMTESGMMKGENVHHINGVKHDNRPENLELWSVKQPRGQRVEDKTSWAIEWLRTYKPEVLSSGY